MISRAAIGLGALGLLASPLRVHAQAGNQTPAPVNAISIDGGYAFRFGSNGKNESYYRVEYRGRPVREHGTPFKSARALDLLAPKLDSAGGDVPTIALRYENAQAYAAGGVIEALGAREVPLAALTSLGLRGAARIGADAKLNRITAAVGLETPPFRLPGLANSGVTNWIVFGVNGERREATDSVGPDASYALGTFRLFVGKAFGWRKSADVNQTAAKLVKDILELAPTKPAAVTLKTRLDSIPANRRTPLQQSLLDAIPEAATDADWVSTVRQLAFGEADAITDQPAAALYAEGSGWVNAEKEPSGGHFRSLFTVTLDYWFLPRRDDVLLKLRYELGYEHADPTTKKNHLLITVGVRL